MRMDAWLITGVATGLVYYAKLNESAGATIADWSGNGLASVVTNGTWAYESMPGTGCLTSADLNKQLCYFTSSTSLNTISYFTGEVLSANDYYAFGATMPGQSFTSSNYRYGFNKQEKDDEITNGIYSAGYWEYDSRLGRRWNTDPLTKKYPAQSAYACFHNNPILFSDPDGLEGKSWPGITFFYFELEIGGGLGYGVNYVHQRGVAYDEVGKTRFVTTSALFLFNQTDSKMSTSPEIVAGGSISGTGNIKQNWSSETFMGLIAGAGVGLPVPVSEVVPIKGKLAYAVAGSISLSGDEFQIGLGIGLGLKVSVISTTIDESISLTDKEYALAEAYGGSQGSWNIINQQAVKNDKGEITGYSGEVKAGKYGTGVKVFSNAIKDEKGDTKNSNIWASKDYTEAAQKAESK